VTRLGAALVLVSVAGIIATGSASASHITLPSSGSFLYMDSEPGDYIGGAVEQLYTEADTSINGSLSLDGNSFGASAIQANYTHWWYANFAAPAGQPLAIGAYENAVRWPFQSPAEPGLSIYGDGRGCNTLSGRFVVNELSRAPTGELIVFDVDFEQHCEGGPAALRGRLRVEYPPPPPDETAPTLYLPGNMTVEAADSQSTPVWYSAYAIDDRDPSPSFSCSPASGASFPVGTTTVSCSATDHSSNTAAGSFDITVLPLLTLSVAFDSVGSLNQKTNEVTVAGTMSCSRAIDVDMYGQLEQLFANRVIISGPFSARVACAGRATRFAISVRGTNGAFNAGAATARWSFSGCELSCHSGSGASSLRLKGKK
jgi:hypothetical protein